METLNAIKKRRTIRRFDSREISDSDLRKILDSGNSAPCAGRLPNWKFIVTRAQADISKLCKAAFNQETFSSASALIIVCSDDSILSPYGNRGEEVYSLQNTAACTENMLLAATSLGIGSAWIGAFDEGLVHELLSIPKEIKVHAIVALGYSAEKVKETGRPNLADIVYFDKWGKSKKNY